MDIAGVGDVDDAAVVRVMADVPMDVRLGGRRGDDEGGGGEDRQSQSPREATGKRGLVIRPHERAPFLIRTRTAGARRPGDTQDQYSAAVTLGLMRRRKCDAKAPKALQALGQQVACGGRGLNAPH